MIEEDQEETKENSQEENDEEDQEENRNIIEDDDGGVIFSGSSRNAVPILIQEEIPSNLEQTAETAPKQSKNEEDKGAGYSTETYSQFSEYERSKNEYETRTSSSARLIVPSDRNESISSSAINSMRQMGNFGGSSRGSWDSSQRESMENFQVEQQRYREELTESQHQRRTKQKTRGRIN